MKLSFLSFVALVVTKYVEAATYSLNESLAGQSFLDAFSWKAISDPTHGRVNYVSEATAKSDGLYSVSGNKVTLRADDTTVLSSSGAGRNSFRIQSNNQYTTHVAIFDIAHMPEGCGTWPAICELLELGADWPNNGEIDIVEGINNVEPNQSTLHTGSSCTMPSSRSMTGTSAGSNCDVNTSNNKGCGVKFDDDNSFGPDFNDIGGGWYAIERTKTYISVYFWERDSLLVPDDVSSPGESIDTGAWGTPAAYFPNTDCNFASLLGAMNIIINLTFCGDWAGTDYSSSDCPSTCVDYVNQNPKAFSNAYFEFNSLNIYQ